MDCPPLTTELIFRLERHLGRGVIFDPDGATYAIFGQTICGKAKGGRPRNKVFCFNAGDLEQLPRILAFYAHDGLQPTFYFGPATFSAEVAKALAGKGFTQSEYQQAILYGAASPVIPTLPEGLTIEPVSGDTANAYAVTMGEAHGWDPAWRESAVLGIRDKIAGELQSTAGQRMFRFLAHHHGEPAGVSALEWRDGIASLGAGGVIPRFRKLGIHAAMLQHRLHLAHQLGAELVVSGANIASTSFRNQQRAGLQMAYIEVGWRR